MIKFLLNFDINVVVWSIMIGMLWILIEQAYEFARPGPTERKCSVQEKNNNNKIKTKLINLKTKSLSAASKKSKFHHEGNLVKVNQDIVYLSREVAKPSRTAKSNFKRASVKVSNAAVQVIPFRKPIKKVFLARNIYKHNLNKECGVNQHKLIEFNRCTELARVNHGLNCEFPGELESTEIFDFVKNIISQCEVNLIQMQNCDNCISMTPCKTVLSNIFKFIPNQINWNAYQHTNLHLTAYFIINDPNYQSYNKFNDWVENCILSQIEIAPFKRKPTGVVITELETEQVLKPRIIDIDNIVEGTRLKKFTKRRKKHKRQEGPVFSSKQCLGRLAYYMSTKKQYSSANLIMEIKKEMQPIKDQIYDIRKSLVDFNIVNCRYNTSGIKASLICIEPIERKKSCFTLAGKIYGQNTSTDYFEIESVDKKLSPLAEMYVKLSQYK